MSEGLEEETASFSTPGESESKRESTIFDPLKEGYAASLSKRLESVDPHASALLCIDLQYLDADSAAGIFSSASEDETNGQPGAYYFKTLHESVLPNVRRLQDAFRNANLEVIHVRIQSLTRDGRDRSQAHKRLGLLAAPGSKEAEILEEVAPAGDEIIINKTASGVFSSTNLYYVLNNLDVESLFIAGVYTNECISTSARDASDLGFLVTVVEDGCATVTPELHSFALATLADRYARIMSTADVIAEVEQSASSTRG